MRTDLSFENIAAVLAALGASALVACGGATPAPVQANEVAPATAGAPQGAASCSAAGCGAKAATPAATTEAPSTTTGTAPATDAASGTTPTATATPAATTAPATTAAPATTTASTTPPKKAAQKAGPRTGKKPAGASACGAGTCASDPKQKIL
jgi:hypothetical protein